MGGSCPAIAFQQWLLERVHYEHKSPNQTEWRGSAHNTNGDLIFSASRVRFTLFQACYGRSVDNTHDRSEHAPG